MRRGCGIVCVVPKRDVVVLIRNFSEKRREACYNSTCREKLVYESHNGLECPASQASPEGIHCSHQTMTRLGMVVFSALRAVLSLKPFIAAESSESRRGDVAKISDSSTVQNSTLGFGFRCLQRRAERWALSGHRFHCEGCHFPINKSVSMRFVSPPSDTTAAWQCFVW